MSFKKVCHLTINGKKWELGYGFPGSTNGKTDDGICNYSKKRITIHRGSSRSLLDVVAHEIIHARLPDIDEKSVNECASLIDEAYGYFSKLSEELGHG